VQGKRLALCDRDVRFGSKADIHRMSALPPKADMSSATRHARYVPEADIPIPGCRHYYSHTSH
jgi:hypothetical protein